MNWTKIYVDFKETGATGNCPNCGNKLDVDKTNSSVTFICPSCNNFRHFDEVKEKNRISKK